MLNEVAKHARTIKGVFDLLKRQALIVVKVIKNRWENAAATTGRSSYDGLARGATFSNGISVSGQKNLTLGVFVLDLLGPLID